MIARADPNSLPAAFEGMRSDYDAAKDTRFRRRRYGLHGSGDSHYVNETKFFEIIEYIRDMERNDWFVGRALDVLRDNVLGSEGFMVRPDTGDEALNQDVRDRWQDWATTPGSCDVQGRRTFRAIAEQVYRASIRDGDVFALLGDDGGLEILEADRARTPSRTTRNVVHGVLINQYRRPIEYWFTPDPGMRRVDKVGEMRRVPAFDNLGDPIILHVADAQRISQTRGVSAFARIFHNIGQTEDLMFAKLVQAQVASFIAFWRKREEGAEAPPLSFGQTEEDSMGPAGDPQFREMMQPGSIYDPPAGTSIEAWSPNTPNPEFFDHVKLLLQQQGSTVDIPLILLLLDGSETNFSGWRGAMDSARKSFRRQQAFLRETFFEPVYRWWITRLMREDAAIRRAMTRRKITPRGHSWKPPGWEYIEPSKDAEADRIIIEALQDSPRNRAVRRGLDVRQVYAELTEDHASAILMALEQAERINELHPDAAVTWKDILFLTRIEGSAPANANENDDQNANQTADGRVEVRRA